MISRQVKHGIMFDPKEKEGTRRRHQVDTIVEGMCVLLSPPMRSLNSDRPSCRGLNRMTANIELALPIINDAFKYEFSLLVLLAL